MEQQWKEISLESLGKGVLGEMFQDIQRKINENIEDPNTDPKKIREMSMKIKYKPDAQRKSVQYFIQAEMKLAPALPFEGSLVLGKEKGKIVAFENQYDQAQMFDGENVTPMRSKENA